MVDRVLDTGSDELLGYVDGHVGVLALNRPDRRNALSDGIYDGLDAGLQQLAVDDNIRVVVITGTGGAFCAGGDVKQMDDNNAAGPTEATPLPEERVDLLRRNQNRVSLAIHHYNKPVIAALPGPTAGAGMSIALSADLRIASESAFLLPAFSNIGATGDFGGSYFMTQLVGPSKARELYFFSPRIPAAEALELGLVNKVVADEGFDEAALAYAKELAARPPIALRLAKENMNRAMVADLRTCLDAEAQNMVRSMNSDDHVESVRAFLDKRTPEFKGR